MRYLFEVNYDETNAKQLIITQPDLKETVEAEGQATPLFVFANSTEEVVNKIKALELKYFQLKDVSRTNVTENKVLQ